ncbi:MOSC domain-containing protein [Methylibium sp.]|uniref:MOSC domain-containing protein n=1 Tax=Methylibium sp. TaxID=2067992 RepID=UPI001838D7D7|nr:MOSC domain-containing protein [Methylibium sp.]MBA3588668.1 MOSC domain-containing protein [Methylibium sp.]
MTALPRLLSVNVAMAQPLRIGCREVLSGINKRGVAGDVEVRPLGLAGDEQADPSLHGGLDKAVYAYPSEHYRVWQTVRAQAGLAAWDAELPAGFFGENLTLEGLLENQVWIGDVLKFAHCELAVAGPRQPCFKFNAVMGLGQASKLMVQSGYCGFYLAVRVPGTIAAGEAFELAPGPREVGIPELFRSVRAKHR